MLKIFEFLGGVMVLAALVDFIPNPKRAMMDAHSVLVAPSPRFVNGHLVVPRHSSRANKK